MKKTLIYLSAATLFFSCTKTEIKEVEKIVEVPTSIALEQVSLSSSTTMTTESDAETITISAAIATSLTEDAIINLNFSGSAELSSDYTVTSNAITISAGELSGSTELSIVSDGTFESGVENIVVSLAGLSNTVTPSGNSSSVQIDVTDGAAMVGFSQSTLTLEETSFHELNFVLSKALNEDIVVNYSSETSNDGYGISGSQLIFEAGETTKTIAVDIDDFRITPSAELALNVSIESVVNDDVSISSIGAVDIATTERYVGVQIDASWPTNSDLFEMRIRDSSGNVVMSSTQGGNSESIFINDELSSLDNGNYRIELDDYNFDENSLPEVVTFTFLDEEGATYGGPYTFTANTPSNIIVVFTLTVLDGVYTVIQTNTSN